MGEITRAKIAQFTNNFALQITEKPVDIVESIDFYISEDYINGVFDSCKKVIMPSTGRLAINFACGVQQGGEVCTPKKWYHYMGDAEYNTFVPFPIRYKYDEPDRAFHAETLPCGEAFPVSNHAKRGCFSSFDGAINVFQK